MPLEDAKPIDEKDDHVLINQAVRLITGKWRVSIILVLDQDSLRFNELSKRLPAISDKVLTQELKAMTALRVVERKEYVQTLPRIEYRLTGKGSQLLQIIRQLKELARQFSSE